MKEKKLTLEKRKEAVHLFKELEDLRRTKERN